MKRRTINAVISKKFDEWLETITDESVKSLVKDNTIATGGCIVSMLLNEKPNDFDFYFRNRETALAVASHYVDRFKAATGNDKEKGECQSIFVEALEDRIAIKVKSAGVASEDGDEGYEYFESQEDKNKMVEFVGRVMDAKEPEQTEEDKKPKYRPKFLSRNAISLSHGVQLIVRFYGEPDQIHENYDYVHCTNYWTSWERAVTLRAEALEAIVTKELRYVGSKYPLCSLFRLKKFVERGWRVNAGQILKIAMNLQEFNLNDLAVLEEQLTGCDVAYFLEIVAKLREKNPDTVDGSYLAELIEKIF